MIVINYFKSKLKGWLWLISVLVISRIFLDEYLSVMLSRFFGYGFLLKVFLNVYSFCFVILEY